MLQSSTNMVHKELDYLLNHLPVKNIKKIISANQSTGDIIQAIIKQHISNRKDAKNIAKYFQADNTRDTAYNIFDFCKKNIPYKVESGFGQTVKTLGRILYDAKNGTGQNDCKAYATLAGNVCEALNIPFVYRFAGYKGKDLTHTYCVVKNGNEEIVIDPVLNDFDTEKPYKNKVDKIGILKPNIESVQYRYDIPTNNAHYQYSDDIIDNPSGSKMIPGKLTLGRGFENSVPTAEHEINHAIQRGRTLKIDDELKNVIPDYKKNLSYDDVGAYTYFKTGSDGQESSSFLAELRSQMKQDGFIKNTYDEITPDLIEKAKAYYAKNKTKKVFVNKGGLQGLTNTRILDFSRATPENYKIISDAMNKLPVIAPIAGASYLATQGQEEPKKFQQGGVYTDNEKKFIEELVRLKLI